MAEGYIYKPVDDELQRHLRALAMVKPDVPYLLLRTQRGGKPRAVSRRRVATHLYLQRQSLVEAGKRLARPLLIQPQKAYVDDGPGVAEPLVVPAYRPDEPAKPTLKWALKPVAGA